MFFTCSVFTCFGHWPSWNLSWIWYVNSRWSKGCSYPFYSASSSLKSWLALVRLYTDTEVNSGKGDVKLSTVYFIKHDDIVYAASWLQWRPIQVREHRWHAAVTAIVTVSKPCSAASNRLNTVNSVLSVWRPGNRSMFNNIGCSKDKTSKHSLWS